MIGKEESLGALWKGHIPSQCLSMVYGTIQFGSFEFLTKRVLSLPKPLLISYGPFANFICGGTAGCLAMTGSFPFDVIRTRLIAQGRPRTYRSMTHAIRMIAVTEGPRGFYRGFLPNLMNIGPYSGLTFAFYRWFITIWARIPFDRIYNKTTTTGATSGNNSGVMETFICGCFAGSAAKMCVYPFDLLKVSTFLAVEIDLLIRDLFVSEAPSNDRVRTGSKGNVWRFPSLQGNVSLSLQCVEVRGIFGVVQGSQPQSVQSGGSERLWISLLRTDVSYPQVQSSVDNLR